MRNLKPPSCSGSNLGKRAKTGRGMNFPPITSWGEDWKFSDEARFSWGRARLGENSAEARLKLSWDSSDPYKRMDASSRKILRGDYM